MATVLGTLSKRLKTDLGELARATIDPKFAARLDRRDTLREGFDRRRAAQLEDQKTLRKQQLEDQRRSRQQGLDDRDFRSLENSIIKANDRALFEKDKADDRTLFEEDRTLERKQSIADQDKKLSRTMQIAAGTKVFEHGIQTGEWGPFTKFITSENLEPMIKKHFERMNVLSGKKSIEHMEREHKWRIEDAELTNKQQKLALERNKYATQKEQWQAGNEILKWEKRFQQMKDIRATHDAENNRRGMIQYVENTLDVESEAERQGFLNLLKNSAPDKVKDVWDEIMKRSSDRLDRAAKKHNALVMARAAGLRDTNPLPAIATNEAKKFANNFTDSAIKNVTDSQKTAIENNRAAFDATLAQLTLDKARGGDGQNRESTTDVMEQVFNVMVESISEGDKRPDINNATDLFSWVYWKVSGDLGEFDVDKAVKLAQEKGIVGSNGKVTSTVPSTDNSLPQGVTNADVNAAISAGATYKGHTITQEDIETTLKANPNLTRAELIAKLFPELAFADTPP